MFLVVRDFEFGLKPAQQDANPVNNQAFGKNGRFFLGEAGAKTQPQLVAEYLCRIWNEARVLGQGFGLRAYRFWGSVFFGILGVGLGVGADFLVWVYPRNSDSYSRFKRGHNR